MRVNAKYKLTDVVKTVDGHTLHRIEAVRDFGSVKSGFGGGWIESESNLAHDGTAWVREDACVYGNARVYDNTWIDGAARVYGNARVCGNATISATAVVSDNAIVCGDAIVSGDAVVTCNAAVSGNAKIIGDAEVSGDAIVYESAMMYGKSKVNGEAVVRGNAVVCDNAYISGNATVCGNAMVCGNAKIKTSADYAVFKNTWTSNKYFTYTKSNKQWIVGGFYGSGDDLVKLAYEESELSGRCFESIVRAQEEIEKAVIEFAE